MKAVLLGLLLALPLIGHAAAPAPMDFGYGLALELAADKPLQTLSVPDAVYAQSLRADLGDIRVFNAADVAVPYALCSADTTVEAPDQRQTLPLFALHRGAAEADGRGRIRIATDDGTRVQILEPVAPADDSADRPGRITAYVIDARGVSGRIRAIHPQWRATGAASEQHLRVQASDDLQHWRTLVADATLLRAQTDDAVLERNRIAVPPGDYRYLRLAASGSGPPPQIERVVASLQTRAPGSAAVTIEARPMDAVDDDEETKPAFVFDSQRQAPIQAAAVALPARNMALAVALDSRMDNDSPWRARWRGQVHDLAGMPRPEGWTPIRFAPSTDRYWRLRILQGADSLAGRAPGLRLSYHPHRLRFLAQGDGPFVLAYASARAPAAVRDCATLAGDLSAAQRRQATGTAVVAGNATTLGGARALQAAPMAIPLRRYLLWGVLVLGALLLVAIALSLLRRIRDL